MVVSADEKKKKTFQILNVIFISVYSILQSKGYKNKILSTIFPWNSIVFLFSIFGFKYSTLFLFA